jgi:hypothetical protein
MQTCPLNIALRKQAVFKPRATFPFPHPCLMPRIPRVALFHVLSCHVMRSTQCLSATIPAIHRFRLRPLIWRSRSCVLFTHNASH